ncbi:cysteine desulfurase DndA [Spectribacter hydrogenoxidans]|uniref:cysteine desulfurase n=1 Tax=Spectribacter hydrogenoxidans TaxID=3075608 RepID=A0ABU3C0J0_9GAMM|nr:cysteine desulfurase DndA [Salinisphaera sp. W335]MDT0634879.1 cysteine desulfurase DndA [Salinisphaera sp. W335]
MAMVAGASHFIPVYLDCNATTPLEPEVIDIVEHYLRVEYGNAGSRTHTYGQQANRAVQNAREQIAQLASCASDEVYFTSGATEANNLSLLGLAAYGEETERHHIVTTAIEHKAVLEPLEALEQRGFEVSYVAPTQQGWVDPNAIYDAMRPDTLLVSVMHANNETGVVQPVAKVAEMLSDHPAFLHTDAAQGFGKDLDTLRHPRIDLISLSGHKLYAPKGIGALIGRRRGHKRPPIQPLLYGGGQERGWRPGTLPVHLIAGLGKAAEVALRDHDKRATYCTEFKQTMLRELGELDLHVHGDSSRTLPHVVNVSFSNIDSEAVMLALRDHVAISNGSACTSTIYEPSHVLQAMGLDEEDAETATRWSWSHLTPEPDWAGVREAIRVLL